MSTEPNVRRCLSHPSRLAECTLTAAARAGDREAFDELARRHQAAVYRYASRMLRSEADTLDCVQDTLLLAWRNIASFRGDAPFPAWLVRIARNRAVDIIRGRRGDTTESTVDAPANGPCTGDAVGSRLDAC